MSNKLKENYVNFLIMVFKNPGCKIEDESTTWFDDGTEYGGMDRHWEKAEKSGLIECVGSYKWIPTKKLTNAVKDAILKIGENNE